MDSLQIPTMLPNGMTVYQDSDFLSRLHNGDASVGWIGDPRLGIYHNEGRIEIWRWAENGEPQFIARSRPGLNVLDGGLLRFLAEHDSKSRRAYNVMDDINTHNRKVEEQAATRAADSKAEAADRLYHALKKDIGHLEGGSTRQFHPLPSAPWKKDK